MCDLGSCTVRKETPGSHPSSITVSADWRSQKQRARPSSANPFIRTSLCILTLRLMLYHPADQRVLTGAVPGRAHGLPVLRDTQSASAGLRAGRRSAGCRPYARLVPLLHWLAYATDRMGIDPARPGCPASRPLGRSLDGGE